MLKILIVGGQGDFLFNIDKSRAEKLLKLSFDQESLVDYIAVLFDLLNHPYFHELNLSLPVQNALLSFSFCARRSIVESPARVPNLHPQIKGLLLKVIDLRKRIVDKYGKLPHIGTSQFREVFAEALIGEQLLIYRVKPEEEDDYVEEVIKGRITVVNEGVVEVETEDNATHKVSLIEYGLSLDGKFIYNTELAFAGIYREPHVYDEIVEFKGEVDYEGYEFNEIDGGEVDAILNESSLLASSEKYNELMRIVQGHDLSPRYDINTSRNASYVVSKIFFLPDDDRPWCLCYTTEDGQSYGIVPMYMSRSHGSWRILPYTAKHIYGKGRYGEVGIDLPFDLQKALCSGKIPQVYLQGDDLEGFPKSLVQDFFEDGSGGTIDYFEGEVKEPIAFESNNMPNFEDEPFDFYDLPDHAQYDRVELYKSQDGKVLLPITLDRFGRVFVSNPQPLEPEINHLGVSKTCYSIEGGNNDPAMNYGSQHDYRVLNVGKVNGSYVDVFWYELRMNNPIVRAYLKAKGSDFYIEKPDES